MLNEKEEEDDHSEDDEEHRYEETQPNNNSTSDDEKKEDKEENHDTFLGRVFETLVGNTKFLKTRGCRSAKIHNFLRGLSVQDFTGLW